MSRLVVVSNRVSLPTERAQRAGGLAVAIREALERTGGMWFGWSGETPDAPSAQATRVTRGKVEYALIDLAPAEFEGFYNGYANSTLWPLFHYRLGLVKFQRADFRTYLAVNARFAAALVPLLKADDVIWIHDYQLLPLAGELRKLGVANRIGFFLHIPLPGIDTLAVLPGLGTLMRGLVDEGIAMDEERGRPDRLPDRARPAKFPRLCAPGGERDNRHGRPRHLL